MSHDSFVVIVICGFSPFFLKFIFYFISLSHASCLKTTDIHLVRSRKHWNQNPPNWC